MYSIRRVLLDYVGYDDAWFENVEIPLFDSSDGNAKSSIISLTNGGGKTTLLSLIFSCFIPEKRSFVQHLQKPNHKFEDYFKAQPGLILIELTKSTGEFEIADDYPWIIGQFVSVHEESKEDDRTYFAFKSSNKLKFEDVPFVSKGEITNIASVRRWIDKVKTIGDAFYYSHQNQTEWYKFLNSKVQIDTWTLSKQVDFCRAEGGIDAYMNFRSEKDFLKEFFHMVMPPEKSAEVRDVLAKAFQKLYKRPEYEKNRALLEGLKSHLAPFTDEAGAMIIAEKKLSDQKQYAGSLHQTLNNVLQDKNDEIENRSQERDGEQKQEHALKSEIKTIKADYEAFRSLYFQKEVIAKEAAIEVGVNELAEQKKYKKEIEAAIILHEKRAVESKIKDLESSIEIEAAGITPFKQSLKEAAGLYLAKLVEIKGKKENDRKKKETAIFTVEQKKQTLRDDTLLITNRKHSLSATSGKLEEKIELRNRKQIRLIKKGFIQESDNIWELTKELSESIEEKVKEIKDSGEEKKELLEDISQKEIIINQTSSNIGELKAKQDSIQINIEKCEEKKETLKSNSILFQLSNGEKDFDPGSPKLQRELNSFLVRKEEERNDLQLKRNHLIHQTAFIEDTDSLLMDTDIKNGLTFLRENGLPQAAFYPDILSKTIPDPEKIKSIIESNPGRFLGIMVKNKDELALAAKLKEEISMLEKPIMVSVYADVNSPNDKEAMLESVVLPPKSSDVYDKDKVSDKLKLLSKEKKALDDRLHKNHQFHLEIQETQQQLKIYLDAYGPEVQTRLNIDLNRCKTIFKEAQQQLDDSVEVKNLLRQKLTESEQNRMLFQDQKTDLENKLTSIREFYRDFEKDFEKTTGEFQNIQIQLEQISQKIEKSENELVILDEQRTQSKDEQLRLISEIDKYQVKINLASEHGTIANQTNEHGEFQSEADLKNKFDVRLEAYENILSDKGFHSLKAKIILAQEELIEKAEEYDKHRKDLPQDDIIKLAENEKDDLLNNVDQADSKIANLRENNGSLLEKLKQTQKEKKKFETDRKFPKSQYEGDSIPIEDINHQLATLQQKGEEAENDLSLCNETIKKLINTISSLKREKEDFDMLLGFLTKHITDESKEKYKSLILPESQAEIKKLVTQCDRDIETHREKYDQANAIALKSFQKVIAIAQQEDFRTLESKTAVELIKNPFEDACRFAGKHLKSTDDRILALTDEIEKTQQDLNICIDHLKNHTQIALGKINSALKHSRIPADVPGLGNQKILRIKANLTGISVDQRRVQLEGFVNELISSQRIPNTGESGDELTAEAVIAITKAKNRQGKLGIEIIKLSHNISYSPVDQIKGSGGESMTTALLLYLVLAQMRMESLVAGKNTPGGFLLLDNPFARATTPQLVEPQVQLAEKLGFQLIYATAIKDFNAQSCFSHIVQLRKVAHDRTHNRTHVGTVNINIESAEFTASVKENSDVS